MNELMSRASLDLGGGSDAPAHDKPPRRKAPEPGAPWNDVETTSYPGVIEADDARCTGCRLCVEVCPGKALELHGRDRVRMIDVALVPCMACGDCVAICEPGALQLSHPQHYTGYSKFLHRGKLSLPRVF